MLNHDHTTKRGSILSRRRKSSLKVTPEKPVLKRHLGLFSASSLIIGVVIGSGIFITPRSVLQNSGSVGLCLIIWAVAGTLALMGALCYAELATMIRKSGGEYTFIKEGWHNAFAFLWVFTMQTLVSPAGQAIRALTFADYFLTLMPTCQAPNTLRQIIGAAFLVTSYMGISWSTKLAAKVLVITSAAKMIACSLIAIGGIVTIAEGKVGDLMTGFEGTTKNPTDMALAIYSAIYAFDGWNSIVAVVEEIKDPKKTIPRAVALSLVSVILLYLLINVAYFTMMTKSELLASDAVAVLWGDRRLGMASIIIPLTVLISTFGSSAGALFASSRLQFAAARDRNFPEIISYVQVDTNSPVIAVTAVISLSLLFLIPSDPYQLIEFATFYLSIFQGMVFVSVLVLRWKKPDADRAYKVPLPIAVLMVMVSSCLIATPIFRGIRMDILYGGCGIVSGLLLYVPFVLLKKPFPFADKITTFFQLVLNLVPTGDQAKEKE